MRVLRFMKALFKYMLFGKRVGFNLYVDRLRTCSNCTCLIKDSWICKGCGCYVDTKAKMSTETCPRQYWMK